MRAIQMIGSTAILLASGVFASSALAGARDNFDAFTQGLKGLDGEFTQQVFGRQGKLKETSTGTIALKAPRQFRWKYVTPYPQLIIADGEQVWIYDPDLEQVTVRAQGVEEQSSPLAALIDPAKLEAMFVVTEQGASDGLEWLGLAPRPGERASFRSARIGFDGDSLVAMEVVDALGQRTVIQFGQWQRNPGFAEGTFAFTPPAGVDVIGGG